MSAYIKRARHEAHSLLIKQRAAANAKKKKEAMTERTALDDYIDKGVNLGKLAWGVAKAKTTQLVDDLLVEKPDATVMDFPTRPTAVDASSSSGSGVFVVRAQVADRVSAPNIAAARQRVSSQLEALGYEVKILEG